MNANNVLSGLVFILKKRKALKNTVRDHMENERFIKCNLKYCMAVMDSLFVNEERWM